MNRIFLLAIFIVKVTLFAFWPVSVFADSSLNGRWLDYFDEGDSIRIEQGVKVTTRKPEERAGSYLKTGLWTWDLSNTSMSFRIKVSDWKSVSILTLMVGNGLKFEKSALIDIRRRFINPPNNEWIEVNIPFSSWSRDGNIDWTKVDSFLVTIADNGAQRVTVEIANIKYRKQSPTSGVISLTFDDGEIDTLKAASVLAKYRIPATAFIDPLVIGTDKFMSSDDIKALAAAGWDIGGHRIGNLNQLSNDDLIKHATDVSNYLQTLGVNGQNLYALPNGFRTEKTVNALSEKFRFIFNIDGMNNDAKVIIRKNINRQSIDKHTSLALAKSWVDAAKNGEWVIINFHTFSDTWEKEEDWSIADFTSLIEYINSQNIPILTVSEKINE